MNKNITYNVLSAVLLTISVNTFASPPPDGETLADPKAGGATSENTKAEEATVAVSTQKTKILKEKLEDCLKAGSKSNVFGMLSTSIGEATLVTADILSAYSSFTNDPGNYPSWPKALGINISSSVPATATTLEDYANAALLLKKGGVLNAYFSLSGSPKWYLPSEKKCKEQQVNLNKVENRLYPTWAREYIPDRIYLHKHPVPPLLRGYLTHGLGIKAFKTGLVDDPNSDNDGKDLAVGGVFYIGFGLNGPVWESNAVAELGPAGTLDFQVTWTYTYVNSGTLRKLYGSEDLNHSSINAAGATLSLFVTNRASIEIEYVAPLLGSKDFMSDAVYFNVAYLTK